MKLRRRLAVLYILWYITKINYNEHETGRPPLLQYFVLWVCRLTELNNTFPPRDPPCKNDWLLGKIWTLHHVITALNQSAHAAAPWHPPDSFISRPPPRHSKPQNTLNTDICYWTLCYARVGNIWWNRQMFVCMKMMYLFPFWNYWNFEFTWITKDQAFLSLYFCTNHDVWFLSGT